MPYRDEAHAAQVKCESLEKELQQARERARELRDAVRNEAKLEADLAEARRVAAKLDPGKVRLTLLDEVRVASPCTASWDAMIGDDRVRFCGECKKNVYNLSAMPREEAEALVRQHDGELCARIYKRSDGTVLSTDCPVGVRRKRRRRAIAAVVGGGALAAGAVLAWPRATQGTASVEMGDIAEVGTATVPTTTPSAKPTPTWTGQPTMGMVHVPPQNPKVAPIRPSTK
jgi:hypothetical protein